MYLETYHKFCYCLELNIHEQVICELSQEGYVSIMVDGKYPDRLKLAENKVMVSNRKLFTLFGVFPNSSAGAKALKETIDSYKKGSELVSMDEIFKQYGITKEYY